MSHGASGDACNPNMTPLLDVVLQLLMFFMMCVNFVSEQVNGEIKLPNSQSAVPMAKSETEVLFVNLKPYRKDHLGKVDFKNWDSSDLGRLARKFDEDKDKVLVMVARPALTDEEKKRERERERDLSRGRPLPLALQEIPPWMRERFRDARMRAENEARRQGKPTDKVKIPTTIIVRADSDTEYGHVYEILNQCKAVGFTNLKLRATIANKPGSSGGAH